MVPYPADKTLYYYYILHHVLPIKKPEQFIMGSTYLKLIQLGASIKYQLKYEAIDINYFLKRCPF